MKKATKKTTSGKTAVKNDQLNFRISTTEKSRFREHALADGFDQLSTWFLWMARNRVTQADSD